MVEKTGGEPIERAKGNSRRRGNRREGERGRRRGREGRGERGMRKGTGGAGEGNGRGAEISPQGH